MKHAIASALAVAGAVLASNPAPVAANESEAAVATARPQPEYDGYQQLLDYEAHRAMDAGKFETAWQYFAKLLEVDPDDARALRESGRIAHALGKHAYAASALARASALRGNPPDPELHYMRGEALLALGEEREAMKELATAEAQIGDAPTERQHIVWRGRCAALRGNVAEAERWYTQIMPASALAPDYAEVMLLRVEALVHNKRWARAERLLRAFLSDHPDHPRGRQLLAWVLEVRGNTAGELPIRRSLANEWGDHPHKLLDYARVLERAGDEEQALAHYRQVEDISSLDVTNEVSRLERRLAPELAAGLSMRNDPTGAVAAWLAGANVPVAPRFRLATTVEGVATEETSSTAGNAWALASSRRGGVTGAGVGAWQDVDGDFHGSGQLVFRTSTARRWQIYARAEGNKPWLESAATFRERGTVDSAEVQMYASPFTRRLVLAATGRARRLGLGADEFNGEQHATQLFGSAGFDYVVASDPGRVARGHYFYDDMVWPSSLADALILSYRHYEMTSEAPFGGRLLLVERSQIDEVSAVARQVLTDKGELAVEVRGGYGLDRARNSDHWRAGSSVFLALTPRSRFALSFDVHTENTSGLVGQREMGSLFLHVDL